MRAKLEKLYLSVESHVFESLIDEARERGISLQTLIRAVIIGEWAEKRKKQMLNTKQFTKETYYYG